jgi:peptidoglycan hydrolase CwlO-like protein
MDHSPFDPFNWLYTGAGAAATAVWSWFRQRKRDAAEIKTAEIENVEKAIEIWRNLASDMRKQVDELKAEVKQLSSEVSKLHHENDDLQRKIVLLQDENMKLEFEIKQLQK